VKKVWIFSGLLTIGLVLSQLLPGILAEHAHAVGAGIDFLTMVGLAFIMIHVGYEFDLDKAKLGERGWDYVVAMTAAAFPWVFVTIYVLLLLMPAGAWATYDGWAETLLAARFAAPTSAGVLFSMLALHVLVVTLLSNLGKMFPSLCYRRQAGPHERLALAVSMWPRGEVGAGILVIALGYGLGGPLLAVALLSLMLNLLLTGVFILIVKALLQRHRTIYGVADVGRTQC
jgi:Kef-type K+ transport system membrane component KefB